MDTEEDANIIERSDLELLNADMKEEEVRKCF